MSDSRVNNENYIQIQGWMIKELNLKGNELLIFAIIYGFSQDGHSKYTAGLQYLADWTSSTKQGCINNLKSLVDKELIIKEEKEYNNIKYCNYFANLEKLYTIKQSLIPIKQSLINNIIDNKNNTNIDKSILDNSEEPKSFKIDLELKENIKCIIDYLNETANTKYKYSTKLTVSLIKARFNDGFVLDDFYDVIDNKWKDWKNTEWQQYMRPETLFGNKFESYLNGKVFTGKPKSRYSSTPTFDNTSGHIKIHHITDEEFNKLTHEQKLKEMEKFDAIADMTPIQREFFNEFCLARDENGNLLKF